MRGTRCLRFRSDPERTCKWTVCLTSDFILCDWYRLHRMVCLCGMLRCKWSRLLLKSKVLWWWSKHGLCGVALCNVYLACFTPGMNQKRETDLREDLRFFLARSGVSGFTRPDEFDLCGCCCCEAPRLYRFRPNAFWSADGPDLHPIGWGDVLFRHNNPLRVDRPWRSKACLRACLRHGLDCLESVEDYLLPRFIDGNPISKYVTLRFYL